MKVLFVATIFFTVISSFVCKKKFKNIAHHQENSITAANEKINLRLKTYATLAKKFVTNNNFSSSFYCLIDMKIPSGKKRFFIYDHKSDSVINAGLVTHGSGSDTETGFLTFSNVPHSNATSLGKYKIGKAYFGKFGLAFKLYGLNNSNSTAFARAVVLHSHPNVLAYEVIPSPIL
ncbi:MAG: murein L,D-transpeptidase catalytic domain-containing protein [Ferruginibacter sp.]